MDKLVSFFTIPLGVAICFGPAVLVWWLTGRESSAESKPQEPRKN